MPEVMDCKRWTYLSHSNPDPPLWDMDLNETGLALKGEEDEMSCHAAQECSLLHLEECPSFAR